MKQKIMRVPFNIRNNIINEYGNNKDIDEYPLNKQIEILQSYMPEKEIYKGLLKTLYSSKRIPFNVRKI